MLRGLWPTRYRLLERLRVQPGHQSQGRQWYAAIGTALLYAAAAAFAAWCSGLLLVAWHFQQLAPWGWVNSLLLMPPAFAVMICGFLRVLVSLAWPLAGAWMGPALDAFTKAMAGAVYWLADWPAAALPVPRPPLWLLLSAYGVLVCLARTTRSGSRAVPSTVRLWRLNAGVMLGIALLLLLWPVPTPPDGLMIDVLAVGDGSAAVLRLPDNRTLVYDCGSLSMSDAGRSVMVPALMFHRVNALDAAIVSHLNSDHYNGLPSVVASVPTARVLLSTYARRQSPPGSPAARLMDMLKDRRIRFESLVAGRTLSFGRDVTCEVLWPPDAAQGPDLSVNDSSLVLRFEYGGHSVLFCGDIETLAQRRLMNHPHLPSDVLILPHHGSVVASTADFIQAVRPSIVIRSSGRTAERTHSSLRALVAGRRYYNTADEGALRIRLGADEIAAGPIMEPYPPEERSPVGE
jgi:competence protein ComEC